MATIKELMERRGACEVNAKRIIETAEKEDRDLTSEEEATFKSIHDDDTKLVNRIERLKQQERFSERLAGAADVPGSAVGNDGAMTGGDMPRAKAQALAVQAWCLNQFGEELTEEHLEAAQVAGIKPSARDLTLKLGNQYQNVRQQWRNRNAGRLQNAMSTDTLATGGAFVPEGFVSQIESAMLDYSGILQIAQVMRTEDGRPMPWPTDDDTSNEGVIVGQGKASSEQSITVGQIPFGAYKITSKVVKVSREMMRDSAFNLVEWLSGKLGERIGRAVNRYGTVGTGVNQPRGITLAALLGTTAASATAITFDEILDLKHSVDPAYRTGPGRGFMCHDNTILVVKKLKDGNGRYIWERSTTAGTPDTIDGDPVYVNQHMQETLATGTKTLLYGNLSKYAVRQVQDVYIRRLAERYGEEDQDGFVAFLEIDGNLLDAGTGPVKYLVQA